MNHIKPERAITVTFIALVATFITLSALILHNLTYVNFICILRENSAGPMVASQPVFMIIAVYVCPITFIVGVIGSVVTGAMEKKGGRGEKA